MDADLLQVVNTTERANLKSALTTAETAIKAVLVTTIGKTATAAEYVAVQDELREVARLCAISAADYPA